MITENQIKDVELLGWFTSKNKSGNYVIETPKGEFIIEDDFDAFWVYENTDVNQYESVDAFSKFEDAIDLVKKWLK